MSKKTEFNFSKKFKLEYVPFDAEINTAHRMKLWFEYWILSLLENYKK